MVTPRVTWFLLILSIALLWLFFALFALTTFQPSSLRHGLSLSSSRDCELTRRALQTEELIFEQSDVQLNESVLINYVRSEVLQPPRPLPYYLNKPNEDPNRREGQHKVVLELLKGKRNGIFIEAGANDGEFLSTTLVLERDYGWTGLLVEPDSSAYAQLLEKNRKAWTANVCLSPRPQKVKFLENKRTSTWSKVANVSEHHKSWFRAHITERTVKCLPLYSLLLALGVTEVDYFSLDVEGAELEVLKAVPFQALIIRVLSIEYDHLRLQPGLDAELRQLMKTNGYRLVTTLARGNANDYIYAHSSIK